MSNPGIWLVAWLLIAPIVALVILSNIGSIEGTKGRDRHRNTTEYRPEADRINRPDVKRMNRGSDIETEADRMSDLGRSPPYRHDVGRTDVNRTDYNQTPR